MVPLPTTDVTPRKLAEAHARMLGEELQHRIKNTLAIVQAIVRQTLRGQPSIAQAQDTIDQRLAAMGRAHGMLTVGGWTNTDLRTLIDAALELHDTRSGRFRVGGPAVRLPAQAAMSLALLLHELFTNATKYGALSTPDGEVDIHWTLQPGEADGTQTHGTQTHGALALELVWRETGGPAVMEPKQRGFGSRLIERSLGNALSGSAVIEFLNQGVVCTVKGLVESIPE
jgi:two-component sensor histidine kinase